MQQASAMQIFSLVKGPSSEVEIQALQQSILCICGSHIPCFVVGAVSACREANSCYRDLLVALQQALPMQQLPS